MDITPLVDSGKVIINSYGPANFKTTKGDFFTDIFITSNTVTEYVTGMEIEQDFEVFIVGTGVLQDFSHQVASEIRQKITISPEIMATSAAIRTFNILNMEDRKVAAILKLI